MAEPSGTKIWPSGVSEALGDILCNIEGHSGSLLLSGHPKKQLSIKQADPLVVCKASQVVGECPPTRNSFGQ